MSVMERRRLNPDITRSPLCASMAKAAERAPARGCENDTARRRLRRRMQTDLLAKTGPSAEGQALSIRGQFAA